MVVGETGLKVICISLVIIHTQSGLLQLAIGYLLPKSAWYPTKTITGRLFSRPKRSDLVIILTSFAVPSKFNANSYGSILTWTPFYFILLFFFLFIYLFLFIYFFFFNWAFFFLSSLFLWLLLLVLVYDFFLIFFLLYSRFIFPITLMHLTQTQF